MDFGRGTVNSINYAGNIISQGTAPLFRTELRDAKGEKNIIDASLGRCAGVLLTGDCSCGAEASYEFDGGVKVVVRAAGRGDGLEWSADILNTGDLAAEWIELPVASLKPLKGEGGEASMLYPFNEGAVIDSTALRQSTWFRSYDIKYPSIGCYPVFPNMLCSQFQAYLVDGFGLYMGAQDPERGLKVIDFYDGPSVDSADGTSDQADGTSDQYATPGTHAPLTAVIRIYCGVYPGEDYRMKFPVIWKFFEGGWEDAAEIYRKWFEDNLPPAVMRTSENRKLPEWYFGAPLVVSYPVRGIHDMDEMKPNALFPYCRALPLLSEIREKAGTDLLVLLMHWEGTAPWAPPYVWPPYGGVEEFNRFRDALHEAGDKLGVYCSGFGYTIKSNLVDDYSCEEKFEKDGLQAAMCVGPDGRLVKSEICPGQRSGYDICPASPKGRETVNEAYKPLFRSGIDYAQILDQNHGGGQYLCYSREHGHPPVPGAWMTRSMQELLSGWNREAGNMLLGCESAAAEPFAGNLLFSDNRFELNWHIGHPVPLFTYIYHEYLRNFMGNQVSSPFLQGENTLFLRLAYSFAAGDCMTIVLTPDGRIMDQWGGRDFDTLPDREEVLAFISRLTAFFSGEAGRFIARGRMVKAKPFDCPTHSYNTYSRGVDVPDVFSSAFSLDGRTMQIFVNHTDKDVQIEVGGQPLTVPARNAAMTEW